MTPTKPLRLVRSSESTPGVSGDHEKRRSALELFGKCQHAWHQLYVLGVTHQSPEARRGTAVHAAIQVYVLALFVHRLTQDLDLARQALIEGLARCPIPPEQFDDVHALYWAFAERFELDLDAYVLHEVRPDDPDDYRLQIDLAYARGDAFEIYDWKTHYRIFSQQQAEHEFQPRMYLARARRIWPGFATYRFRFVFLRFGCAEVVVEYSAAELDAVDEHIKALEQGQAEALLRGEFPATPGDHCGFCALACPVADDPQRAPVRIVTDSDRDRFAGEYLALTQAVRSRRAALQAYCTTEGEFEHGGARFGFRQQDARRFPAAGVVDVLRAADVEPKIQIGATPLRSFLTAKKWAHVRPELEALAVVQTKTRFAVQRATVADDEVEDDDQASE